MTGGVRIPSPVISAEWINVNQPKNLSVIGAPLLAYRVCPSGEYEVKWDWKFPSNIDMEIVLNLLYCPGEFIASLSGLEAAAEQLDLADRSATVNGTSGFFGFTGNPVVKKLETSPFTDSGSDSPMIALVDRFVAYFKDPRRHNGIAVANLIKTMGLGVVKNTVIIALVSDQSLTTSVTTNYRQIKHLYYAGCEVSISSGSIRGIASLSSESIFLLCSDLLGEKGRFWECVEKFSSVLTSVSGVASCCSGTLNTPVSVWIRNNFINST
jgi:hypothetical protein